MRQPGVPMAPGQPQAPDPAQSRDPRHHRHVDQAGTRGLRDCTDESPRRRPAQEPVEGWMTPGVKGIGTASLLADIGHEIPTALLPSLLTSTLGAPASALGSSKASPRASPPARRASRRRRPRRRTLPATHRRLGGYATTAVLSAGIGATTAVGRSPPVACRRLDRSRSARPRPQRGSSPTSSPPTPTAAPTGSNGPWTTSAPSSARCSPSSSLPPSRHPLDPRTVRHPRPACRGRDHLRHPPHRQAEGDRT